MPCWPPTNAPLTSFLRAPDGARDAIYAEFVEEIRGRPVQPSAVIGGHDPVLRGGRVIGVRLVKIRVAR
jgi:hypothetical protein